MKRLAFFFLAALCGMTLSSCSTFGKTHSSAKKPWSTGDTAIMKAYENTCSPSGYYYGPPGGFGAASDYSVKGTLASVECNWGDALGTLSSLYVIDEAVSVELENSILPGGCFLYGRDWIMIAQGEVVGPFGPVSTLKDAVTEKKLIGGNIGGDCSSVPPIN